MTGKPVFKSSDFIGVGLGLAVFAFLFFVPVTEAEPPNSAPQIQSVQTSHSVVYPGDSCSLVCQASDDDGDTLTYEWTSTGGTLGATRARARWTAPSRPGQYAVTASVTDPAGDGASAPVIIEVLRNGAPIVESLWCQADELLPGDTTSLLCTASDPDGHNLAYEWSCALGQLESSGPEATWTAPMAPGAYVTAVKVVDAYGGQATRTALLRVYSPEPPVIEELIVRPRLQQYSSPTMKGYRLIKGSKCECDMECVASAGEKELTYEWATTAGEIRGRGPSVVFVPPSERADVVVSVTVSDAFNQSAYTEAFFNVYNREVFAEDDDSAAGGCGCG